MFVIEKLVRDHEARNEAWERARDKWKQKNDYYSSRDYEDRYPRPGHAFKVAGKVLGATLLGLVFVGLLWLIVTSSSDHHKNHPGKAAVAQTKETKQAEFHVGDKVQVVRGDYEDSVGVIVRLTDSDAIIKLTNSTLTHAMCNASSSCSSGGGHDNGELLGIGSLDNLVPYKEVK